jgi:hypothetical protein
LRSKLKTPKDTHPKAMTGAIIHICFHEIAGSDSVELGSAKTGSTILASNVAEPSLASSVLSCA